MKRFIIIAVVLIFILANSAFAQLLSIQGVARDSEGQSLPDGSYTFKFRLYNAETGGTMKWTEDQALVVTNGVFSANLGAVTSMSGLDFNVEYWLSIDIGGNGELSPRSKLTLTPYAAMAQLSGTTNIFPASGAVGIGTKTPTKQLTINSSDNTAALSIGGALSNEEWTGIQMGYDANDADAYHKVGIFYKRVEGYALGSLIFATDNTSDDSNVDIDDARMTITKDGNVGIGTNTPHQRLEVNKPNSNTRLRINRTSNTYESFVEFSTGDAGKWLVGLDNSDDDFRVYTYDGAGVALTIDGATGNVGIDDTSPGALLDVNGDIFVKGGKPIVIRRYTRDNDETHTFTTGYSVANWSAAVIGFNTGYSDIDEDGAEGSWKVLCEKGATNWEIKVEGHTHNNHPDWTIDVMYIKRQLTDDNR